MQLISIVLLAGTALLISSCAPHTKPVTTPAAVVQPLPATEPASQPVAMHIGFDIPRLTGITVDSDRSQWNGQGFLVDVMHSSSFRRLPAVQFDAQLQLGWDNRGLLLLTDVTDSEIQESDDDLALTTGTSVEITVTDRPGKEVLHETVSPGVDPRHASKRTIFVDERTKPRRAVKASVVTAVKKTPQGYTVAAFIPWSMLAIAPQTGSEAGFTIKVNHPDSGRVSQLVWTPAMSLTKAITKSFLRLSELAASPVELAADGGYERSRRARITIAAAPDAAGKTVVIQSAGIALGQDTLRADTNIATANISLPMLPAGKSYGPMSVELNGVPAGTVTLSTTDGNRRDGGSDLALLAFPSVFSLPTLPVIDFANPEAAEDQIGTYSIHKTYYDADYNVVRRAEKPGRYGAVVDVTPQVGKPFRRYLTLCCIPRQSRSRPPQADPDNAARQMMAVGDFINDQIHNGERRNDDLAILLTGLKTITPGTGELPYRLGPFGQNMLWWYGLRKQTGDLVPYKYLAHVPDTTKTAADEKFPLMLFLHGVGERGNNLDDVKRNGPPKILKNEPNWPYKDKFIVISPQCPMGDTWNPLLLRDLLDEVSAKYPVDPDRIYLTGLSMGGFGTWELTEWFPEKFAAIAVVCGGGDPAEAPRLKDIPTWVFHGKRDPTVRVENAYEMVQAMRNIHARIRFTLYPDYGHNAWLPTYDDHKLYDWLLEQRRGKPTQAPSTVSTTQPGLD